MSSVISPSWISDQQPLLASNNDKRNAVGNLAINSPLLFNMMSKLSLTERRSVLDMGRASESSVEFFSDFWCKLFITHAIGDLHRPDLQTDDAPHAWHKTLARTIQFYNQQKPELDIILLWSLPNYLTPHHLKELIDYLLPCTSPGTLLHAYIYNTEKMPAVPAHYHIRQDNKVEIAAASSEQKNCPLYHMWDLHNCFSPLKVEHSMMLSSGIQEYLFSA